MSAVDSFKELLTLVLQANIPSMQAFSIALQIKSPTLFVALVANVSFLAT